jgi:hypothetical protein
MRMRDELWQGCSHDWQNRLIHHNILTIGHIAWNGWVNLGKGMVACDLVDAILPSIDWRSHTVNFNREFIPQVQVAIDLQEALELEKDEVTSLLRAIGTYDPTQEIVVLVRGNGAMEINLLQNLAISPADCYRQVQQRWEEFQTDLTPQRKRC